MLLLQEGVGNLGRGFAHLLEFFFRLIFDLQKIIDRHSVFCRRSTGFSQPASIHIEAAGRLTERSRNDLLPFPSQQPIDKNLGSIRMRRRFNDRQIAAPAGAVSALFERRKGF